MTLFKLASKQEVIERYLYRNYAPFISAQYRNAITDKNEVLNGFN